jgi:PAS domain S-box-containing protein
LVVFWSLALADRMNTLKKESETSRVQIMQNERRIVQYMDSLPIGVLVYDGDANLRYINRQSKMILHLPGIETPSVHILHRQNEETSDPATLSNPDADYPHPIEQLTIRHVTQQRVSAHSDHVDINLGDTSIPVEIWSNPLVDDSGENGGTVVAFQNIQERLHQQELLRKSEQLRQTILEGANLGTFSTDLVSGEVIWDSRTREIFGVDADTPATLELGFGLIYPADRNRAQESYERAIDIGSDGIYEEEKRIIRPDGEVRWISTRGTVTFGQNAGFRQALNLVGIIIDVTAQKQAEKELEESRIHYQNLVETMNEGLSIVDENLILTYVNPRLSEC